MDQSPTPPPSDGTWYRLRIRGHLAAHWSAWFDGLTLTAESDGTTTLEGSVVDAAALYGLIARLRDLGLTLQEVQALKRDG